MDLREIGERFLVQANEIPTAIIVSSPYPRPMHFDYLLHLLTLHSPYKNSLWSCHDSSTQDSNSHQFFSPDSALVFLTVLTKNSFYTTCLFAYLFVCISCNSLESKIYFVHCQIPASRAVATHCSEQQRFEWYNHRLHLKTQVLMDSEV